jgi:hypothetical protein
MMGKELGGRAFVSTCELEKHGALKPADLPQIICQSQ